MTLERSAKGARYVRLFCLLLLSGCLPAAADTTIRLLHFSDYHSHALPHDSEGRPEQGGIARLLAYLTAQKARGAIAFSGGDMMNRGAPAWSDKYQCTEWSWFNGLLDAMAFGNHDSDYGPQVFAACHKRLRFPILSANTVNAAGAPLFAPYEVIERKGVRVGVFALAGRDFETLMRPELRPEEGARFEDPLAAARETVRLLREKEKVALVVMIGHQGRSDDWDLARRVPGIDLIFGTHSHVKEPLTRISGTLAWFVSPFQYATYVSRVDVTIGRGGVRRVRGALVPMDRSIPVDRRTQDVVRAMQRALEADPQYAPLFRTIGRLSAPLTARQLGQLTLDAMRAAAGVDIAISTTSSFRQDLPAGEITFEMLRASLPYDNEILVAELPGDEVRRLIRTATKSGGGEATAWITELPTIDDQRRYRVATTDYVARVSPEYRSYFAGRPLTATGLRVREELRKQIAAGNAR